VTPLNEEEKEKNLEEICQLLDQRKVKSARARLVELLDPDIADLLQEMTAEQRLVAFNLLPLDDATEVFSFFSTDLQEELIDNLKGERLRSIINEMEPDDRAVMLEDLPDEYLERLLSLVQPEDRAETEKILSYPPESVGRILTPNFLDIRPEWTAQQALNHIRKNGADAEIINIIYVTDSDNRFLDFLFLKQLILAEPDAVVESLLDGNYVSLSVNDDREEAVTTMGRYDLPALPVVDDQNRLAGIVTFDDVADVAEEEVTEDFHKGGSVAPIASYREASIWALFQKRIGWLMLLVVVNLVSSGVIAAYEETLAAVVTLAFFIPLLIDSGGNTGSQSAVLLIRALATGDIKLSQWLSAFTKEIGVGIALGVTLGAASYFLGIFRGGPEIGIIVGLSMVAIVLAANLIGALLPFILIKIKIDPAVAGSPLITSIADSVGLLIYFSIATAVLSDTIALV